MYYKPMAYSFSPQGLFHLQRKIVKIIGMHNMKCILWELYFFYRVYSFFGNAIFTEKALCVSEKSSNFAVDFAL